MHHRGSSFDGVAVDSAEPTSLPARGLSRLDMGRSFSANSTASDTATIASSGFRNAADGFRKTPDSH
ncbi:hypothetical protein FA379_10775 [Pseudomonas aeruginosa]|nr:hypothetical protein [Pseudomonas aeruginosa]MCO2236681.1 hypothetical protein [Pseudomonas aeruginosa]MCO2238867.1 hypothetical protein [Pseudomonas aeruginosa]MCO2336769.1 hypothetical protein [Pseudomonas aeruginosa]MCO2358724.1 hypothetical protein [Pseudomonas aeruginosa]